MKLAEFKLETDDDLAGFIRRYHSYRDSSNKPLKVTVQEWRAKRSINQNAALFGHAYNLILEKTPGQVNDLHRHFCCEYFGRTQVNIGGQMYERPTRTTTVDEEGKPNVISTRDFANLFEFVQAVAATDMDVVIPDPDKDWKEKLKLQIEREEENVSTGHNSNDQDKQQPRQGRG